MRAALYFLLALVAAAAAVLSFNALRDLAVLCGITPAWLLPVVVDAGAAAGSLVWLGGHGGPRAASFARRLALTLLGVSIVANALSHGAAAGAGGRPWWVIVVVCVVSALPPAVLGAVIHLAVRCRQGGVSPAHPAQVSHAGVADRDVDTPAPERTAQDNLQSPPEIASGTPVADIAPPALDQPDPAGPPGVAGCGGDVAESAPDRAAELIAAGVGRRRLSRELDITEHEARRILAGRRNGHLMKEI